MDKELDKELTEIIEYCIDTDPCGDNCLSTIIEAKIAIESLIKKQNDEREAVK